jgi:hypothetical protein
MGIEPTTRSLGSLRFMGRTVYFRTAALQIDRERIENIIALRGHSADADQHFQRPAACGQGSDDRKP